MPRKGENIRRRNDGRWEGRYYTVDDQSGKKQYHSLYAHSYREVKEKLIAVRTSRLLGGECKAQRGRPEIPVYEKTFGEMTAVWLSHVKENKKYSTYAKYEAIYQKHLLRSLESLSVNQIHSALVSSMISSQGIRSESMIRSIYCVINQVILFVNKNYDCNIAVVSRNKSSRSAKPVEILKKSEQIRLLEILYQNMDLNKLGIVMCLFTGLRLGEICSLKWNDIDLNGGLLYVNRTVQRIAVKGHCTKTELMEGEPKSIFSKRVIPLPDELIQIIRQFKTDDEYVISKDRPTEPRTYQYRFHQLLKEAGIVSYNFHVLRHTFATNCIASGADIKSLSEILGHSGVNITLDRYVHPSEETKRMHLNALSAIYGQYLGQNTGNG